MRHVLLAALRFYQRWVSPLTPPQCRYYPSCSNYAYTAVATHGAVRGSWLAARRLLRCHPFTPGGYDPVPAPRAATTDGTRPEAATVKT